MMNEKKININKEIKANLILFGGTGMIGKAIINFYLSQKSKIKFDQIYVVSRRSKDHLPKNSILQNPQISVVSWGDELISYFNVKSVIINLVGENIAAKSWSPERKKALIESRINSTEKIVSLLKKANLKSTQQPIWFNASAVGFYDDENDEIQTENNGKGNHFLGDLCYHWEEAAQVGLKESQRLILMRLGVVLGEEGALKPIRQSIKFGVGAFVGKGGQGFPWIYEKEIPLIIDFLLTSPKLKTKTSKVEIYNFVAPLIVTSDDFNKDLATKLNRKIRFRASTWFLNLILGERAMLVAKGPKVISERLKKLGYQFHYDTLSSVWNDLLKQ